MDRGAWWATVHANLEGLPIITILQMRKMTLEYHLSFPQLSIYYIIFSLNEYSILHFNKGGSFKNSIDDTFVRIISLPVLKLISDVPLFSG